MSTLCVSELNILLVEPSALQRKIMIQQLQDEQVTAIDTASSLHDALEKMLRVPPDLVISTLHFDDGSAVELLGAMRRMPQLAEIPFMLVSSETRKSHLEVFKQSGVVAILPKPFTRHHLGSALNATLDVLDSEHIELAYYDIESLRVLIVDDSRMARNLIRRVLSNLGIVHLIEAEDGREAINRLGSETVDLVVTDYNMPEVNGLELTEFIRHSELHAHLPVLMVTSEANEAHLSQVAQSGVNALTDKPFEPETVKRLLIQMLNQS
ncbi:MAG: response regulator [Oceanospirillales bacterium]|uniref:Two-component system chemotaxis response regulator CheY n=1 Tax=Marinobacterium halophilum TaxID=267374 RepID=A0A2P8F1Z7_9GAMM|nr:response regulator [Marinobacterium halophilum]MBR9830452.1 response regulator [Oceanospirillales bacterium]PSL15741.1 two-component system chemotaxis response regulator CheY [Marinobacterium halophilum]